MAGQKFGVIGLEVMGRNIALNIERNGFPVAVYNRTWEKTEHFVHELAQGKRVAAGRTLAEFVPLLERPRRILIMVKAGAPVDAVIAELRPHLEAGDIVIDGGNSHFTDTERRIAALEGTDIRFVGMGVSGGEEGALWGPSLMPGGDRDAYRLLEPILTRIAAKSDSGPCVTYVGARGAGHFVKMVHNGIEYGDMQLIAEVYDLLKTVGGLSDQQLSDTFAEWNRGDDLQSFLIEIASTVLARVDPETGKPLVELILDKAGAKGTGKWTVQTALDLGIAVPTIAAAVDARNLSAQKAERRLASTQLPGPPSRTPTGDRDAFVTSSRDALYCSKICSYAQGYALMAAADEAFGYGLDFVEISRIWKAGCIIRAVFLDDIMKAYQEEPHLRNLLLAARFRSAVARRQDAWRRAITTASDTGIPAAGLGASLAYYDTYRRDRLPANLIQALRDCFGAHTYERSDKPGTFHTDWSHPPA